MSVLESSPMSTSFLGRRPLVLILVVTGLFLLGALVRLLDLTDPPLDFHGTRQLRNAIVARGIFYRLLPGADPVQSDQAIRYSRAVGQYEPSITESLTAATYLLMGQEVLWISRVYTSMFWLVGGLALFDLARRMTSVDGAVVALAYYLLLPFAVQASRSFQPDPGMVMWFILGVNGLYRWMQAPRWKWVILAGLASGMAVLFKVVIAPILAGAAIAVVLVAIGMKKAWRDAHVWGLALFMVLPTGLYYLIFSPSGRITEYVTAWTLSLLGLLASPAFYIRWMSFVHSLVGLAVIVVGLLGVVLSRPAERSLLAGLWVGYLLYGLTLPYQMYTHNYYHLQLVPILALSIAPVAQSLLEKVSHQPKFWQIVFVGIAVIGIAYPAWVARSTLMAEDYRAEPVYWQEVAETIPSNASVVALIQDYGYRLMYYGWRNVAVWPVTGEQDLAELRGRGKDFEERFADETENRDYFLVTAFGQFNQQPELRRKLEENYPLVAQGDGYLLYDLRAALPPAP